VRTADWSVMLVTPSRFEGRLLLDVLRSAGVARTQLAADSEAAFGQLARDPANIVLIAHDATPIDALRWVRQLRRSKTCRARSAPVLVLTRSLTASVAEACRIAGANAVIGLPASGATLLTTIRKVLATPRPFVEDATYVGPCRRAGIVTAGAGSHRRRTDGPAPTSAARS